MSKGYRDLKVWQFGVELSVDIYEFCKLLPEIEKFGLISQLQRAAVSVPSNIAEGQRRYSSNEMARFAGISLGSVAEIETQLEIVSRVYDLRVEQLLLQCDELSKMLVALVRSAKNSGR